MTLPSTPPPAPSGQRGTNWGKIALFGCLGIVVLTLVIGIIGGGAYFLLRDDGGAGGGETVLYRSADHTFSGVRAENFVDFSFRYPAHWEVVEDESSDTPNFVKVESKTDDNFTVENFAVGYITGDLHAPAILQQLEDQLISQLTGGFPNFQRVMNGPTTIAERQGRFFTFMGHLETEERGDLEYYGRVVLLPVTRDRGLVMLAFATELSPSVEGPAQVGERGELAGVFESFEVVGAPAAGGGGRVEPEAATTETFPGLTVLPSWTALGSYPGELGAGDPLRDDGTLYDAYQLVLETGRSFTLTLESEDFDAYLTVVSPSGAITNDDDSAGGTNARISMVADEAGAWTFLANTLRPGESGEYLLRLEAGTGN